MAKSFKPAPPPASKPAPASARPASPISAAPAARSSDFRNSPLPKTNGPAAGGGAKKEISHDAIARRAYEIWQSGKGGSDYDNWIRAERELRGS